MNNHNDESYEECQKEKQRDKNYKKKPLNQKRYKYMYNEEKL